MKASPEIPQRQPAPPAAADVQPPSYVRDPQLESLKRRPQRHHCHFSWLPYPSELALIRILFILNAVLLLATIGACIVMLFLAIREKDPYPRRLRWSLFLLEIGFTFFYAREYVALQKQRGPNIDALKQLLEIQHEIRELLEAHRLQTLCQTRTVQHHTGGAV